MTRRFHVEFRGQDYVFGLTGNVAHGRNETTGTEALYKRRASNVWERRIEGRLGSTTTDIVFDKEFVAVLEGLFARSRETA